MNTSQEAKGTILVADDEPGMRMALREALRRAGWNVLMAESGPKALEELERTPAIDLLITDFRMPGMNGMELLREARRRRPGLPVAMMTAYGAVEDAVAAMREGAADYLLKPFSMETALDVVDRAMRGGRIEIQATPAKVVAAPHAELSPVAASPALRRTLETVKTIADADSTVLLTGESGVGKEVIARAIHQASGRRGPLIAVNCAALPDGLLESELFGHEKGAFTGAVLSRKGRFEQAEGGTLLLDEVSEMPLALQAKLLRVLQEREISPVGSAETIKLDVRVIATTNRDLDQAVAEGAFRQDLFYRLNVIALRIPPLRERREDILPLADHFLAKFQRASRPARRFSEVVRQRLPLLPWVGNVRELENLVERASLLARAEEIQFEDFDPSGAAGAEDADDRRADTALSLNDQVTLQEMERRLIMATLERTGGNRTRTADVLGVSVRTIRNKLNEYGIKEIACATR